MFCLIGLDSGMLFAGTNSPPGVELAGSVPTL
jgi:hypothetical protein